MSVHWARRGHCLCAQSGWRRHLGLGAGGAQQSPAGHSSSGSHGRADDWRLPIWEDGRGWGPRTDAQGQEGGGAGAWTGRGVHSGQAHTRVDSEGSVAGKTRLLTLPPAGLPPAPGWDGIGALPGSSSMCPVPSMPASFHPPWWTKSSTTWSRRSTWGPRWQSWKVRVCGQRTM